MRLWSLHPRYLDRLGLVAVWREALLAKAVLEGNTRGYRHHPQVLRFRKHSEPLQAISYYLSVIHQEAEHRSYKFDESKFGNFQLSEPINVTEGQMLYEKAHLLKKLRIRSEKIHDELRQFPVFAPHPLFSIVAGEIEEFEKGAIEQQQLTHLQNEN